jgi:quinol monooxygenase YgiN
MIVQIVRASIKPDHRDRWLEVIRQNAAQTRAEEGCEGYQVAEDLEMPNTFVIVEMFTNMEVLYEHLRNQFEGIMGALGDAFAAPPDASIHEIASTKSLPDVLAEAGIAQ